MKNLKILVAALLIGIPCLDALGQENALNLRSSLTLNENSTAQTVKVEVVGEVENLKIEILCSLEKGEVIIELFDPEGKRQGKFTLGSKTNVGESQQTDGKSDSKNMEDGKLEKLVANPVNGDWLIKITPTKTKARLSIRSSQVYKK